MLDLYLRLANWLKGEQGQDLVEYALLLFLLAVVCILAITAGGQTISSYWMRPVVSALQDVAS